MASKKKTPAKKTSAKKKAPNKVPPKGGRPKAGEPTKADFIRAKLQAGMSVGEIVKAGADSNIRISPPQVYKLKAKTASGGAKKVAPAAAAKPAAAPAPAKRRGRSGGASDWIRAQLASGKTPAEVWAAAAGAARRSPGT